MRSHPGSFRDPAGFVFTRHDEILRAILPAGEDDYKLFADSGLAEELLRKKLLLPFEEIDNPEVSPVRDVTRILKTQRLAFYSFPYEWSVAQLRDAALLTLRVLRIALKHGMTLKDASAFNVSFDGARPVFTDLLSFTSYREGEPWSGYLQFCEQFLVPLLLSQKTGTTMSHLLRPWHDG
ncbi:MAG: SAM-dependent methyltransferase, partial [Bacteroidetes bacterium]|nr:SAM-dependent methyltransferase [Bacteroidota bacterium]